MSAIDMLDDATTPYAMRGMDREFGSPIGVVVGGFWAFGWCIAGVLVAKAIWNRVTGR